MKAIIKIYQIEDVANTAYAFRGWEDHKDLFTPDLKDYKEVAHFEYDEGNNVAEILDKYSNSATVEPYSVLFLVCALFLCPILLR